MLEENEFDELRALREMSGLLGRNADFRVMDTYKASAKVTPALKFPFQWLNDAWQIGETDERYRYGFISKLHDMVRFFRLERQGGDFLCLGKRNGGADRSVVQTVMRSEEGLSEDQIKRQRRSYKIRFDEINQALERGVRVFFVYYNTSSGTIGSHWTVSVYVLRGLMHTDSATLDSYYFDSFGRLPTGEIRTLHEEYDVLLWRVFSFSHARRGTYSVNTENWQGKQVDSTIDCGVWICWCMLQTIVFSVLAVPGDISAFMKTRHALLETHIQRRLQLDTAVSVGAIGASGAESLAFRELFFKTPRLRLVVVLFDTAKWQMLVTDLRRALKERVLLCDATHALVSTIRANHPSLARKTPKGFEIDHPNPMLRTNKDLLNYYEKLLSQSLRAPHRLATGPTALYNVNDFTILAVIETFIAVD